MKFLYNWFIVLVPRLWQDTTRRVYVPTLPVGNNQEPTLAYQPHSYNLSYHTRYIFIGYSYYVCAVTQN